VVWKLGLLEPELEEKNQ